MTELEILESEKYWCENCCNWDKKHVQMNGYAKCKLTGTLCFCQESGKDCKCFNAPAENVIVPPCKVGDFIFAEYLATNEIESYVIDKVIHNGSNCFSFEAHLENEDGYVVDALEFDLVDIGIIVFLSSEEAEAKLKEGAQG